ncbi:MAG: hypothetical protein RLP14_06855 [Owenweeksia sp.]
MTLLADSDFFDKTPWWILLVVLMLNSLILRGQKLPPVEVANLTLKVGGLSAKEFYYGFAEGDEILFSFEEQRGKKVKEIEIIELPGSSKFMDYRSTKVEQKKIKVYKKGIYRFRFTNSALGKRVCKVHIQRIPASEALIAFNTDWQWETRYDTSFVPYTEDSLVRYDTSNVQVRKKEKVSDELELITLLENHSVEVHSKEYNWTISGEHYGKYNEEIVRIDLPATLSSDLKIVENMEWDYSVSVDQKMKVKTQKRNQNLMSLAGNASSTLYGPQMKIAFEAIGSVTGDHSDQSIYCALIPDYKNAISFKNDGQYRVYREDNLVSSPGIRRDRPLEGSVYLGLSNPNERDAVTVYVNCYVWRRTRTFRYVNEIQEKVKPVYTTLHKNRMVVSSRKVRANVD